MLDGDLDEAKISLFKALGDRTRLAMLEALHDNGEMSVSELTDAVGQEQSLVSHHLACLRNCGLVRARREGRRVHYRLNGEDRVAELLDLAEDHVAETLEDILACRVVEEDEPA